MYFLRRKKFFYIIGQAFYLFIPLFISKVKLEFRNEKKIVLNSTEMMLNSIKKGSKRPEMRQAEMQKPEKLKLGFL